MANEIGEVQTRAVMRRGCGYPKPGGVYLESQGEAGGTLPIIIVLDPPVPHDHFHRGFVYVDLDRILASQEIKYVGSSVASAEEWHLRQKYQAIAHDVFGPDVRIKNGQVIKFRDTAVRILMQSGWQPGGVASAMQAARILRERAEELAPFVQATKTDAS